MPGTLYLIPTTLGGDSVNRIIPPEVQNICIGIRIFIVEEVKTARRFIIKLKIPVPIDELTFLVFNEHSKETNLDTFIQPLLQGQDVGLLSEAGVPAVADPGNEIVKLAHSKNIKIAPLTGPSSILLALMASGLNGQNFAFNGYLPVPKPERIKKIKIFERRSETENQTQIFIETPYRNKHLIADIIESCNPNTYLCIACNLTLENEFIKTMTVSEWKKNIPEIHKNPAIFLIHKF